MKLGVGTYTFMWAIGFNGAAPAKPMTAADLLARARELDVRLVQYGPNLSLGSLQRDELDHVLAKAREWKIEIEVGTRGVEADRLRPNIALAVRCGSTLLRSVPELEGGRVPSVNELVAYLRQIEPDLRAAGVRLALENSLMPAADLRRALDEVGSPFCGVTLDTVNSLAIPEGTRHVATQLARWTHCLHIKDFAVRREWHMMGFRVEGRPAGEGQLNVPWLLEELGAAGAKCNAVLELWPPEQSTLEETIRLEERWARQSIAYLRRFIQE